MKLNQLKDNKGARKNRIRVGRGIGSGKGKTAGRGVKGQKARSGVSVNGFEGGQMPIYRRIPKRGFANIHRIEFQKVNVGDLQRLVDAKKLDEKKPVTLQALYDAGFLKKLSQPYKVLGKGALKAALTIEADAASESALKLVKKAGGSVTLTKKETKAA